MAQAKNNPKVPQATRPTTKPPYPFRTAWALVLLGINFLVAAYYFHIIE
ncbi:MAG TPA: photosystem I protein PsaX [Leptolyngbyaceae cyanobacterium]